MATFLSRIHPVHWLPMPKTRRLRWQLSLLNRSFEQEMLKARKAKADTDTLEGIQHGWWIESDEIQEELEKLRTRRLLRKAYRLDVPVPSRPADGSHRNEHWEQGMETGSWHLTTAGINRLRTDIRTEILARQATRAHWLQWGSVITGILGALTGLVATIVRR